MDEEMTFALGSYGEMLQALGEVLWQGGLLAGCVLVTYAAVIHAWRDSK